MSGDAERPMAGHRSATSLALVFGSIAPVTLGSVLVWGLLELPVTGYTFGVLLGVGGLAAVAPYAVGWLRGLLSLLALGIGLPWMDYALRDLALVVRIVAPVVAVVAVGGLTWWSMRLGHVRRPSDAKQWREKRDDTWPYPYA